MLACALYTSLALSGHVTIYILHILILAFGMGWGLNISDWTWIYLTPLGPCLYVLVSDFMI
jgi:hypothetical protein